ncbi:MAG: hypothetical protein ACI35S_09045 [Anaeroplasma sp.]
MNQQPSSNPSASILEQEARQATDNKILTDVYLKLNIADELCLGDIDLWLAKQVLSVVNSSIKKFPAIRSRINYFGTTEGLKKAKDNLLHKLYHSYDIMLMTMLKKGINDLVEQCNKAFEGNALASAFYMGSPPFILSGILVNHKALSEISILKNLEYSEKSGFNPKSCKTIKSVIDHEIGHLLDYILNISDSYDLKKIIKQYTIEQIGTGLSKYCIVDNIIHEKEVLAEAYSEYCNALIPRPISKSIGLLITQKYNQTFGVNNQSTNTNNISNNSATTKVKNNTSNNSATTKVKNTSNNQSNRKSFIDSLKDFLK